MTRKLIEKFISQYIDITTDRYISVQTESENGMFVTKKPLVISGYLMDMDKTWVYIGGEENSLSDMLKIKRIIGISISKPIDEYDEMLDDANPTSNQSYN